MSTLDAILAEYHDLQTRALHPSGRTDKGGRWYPSDEERQECCRVRRPSRAYPWSLMVHCRTLTHVATRRGVPVREARSALARMIAAQRPARTAPSGLCLTCGASWDCDHQTFPSEALAAGMVEITPDRADMSRHVVLSS